MKINAIAACAVFAISSICISTAQASPDYSGSNVNMGTVAIGQSGVITNASSDLFPVPPNWVSGGQVFGYLPHDSKITFSYSITGLIDGQLKGNGGYDYSEGPNHYQGSATSDSLGSPTSIGTLNGSPSTPLVLSSANLTVNTPGTSTGTVSITNISNALANFQATFFGILKSSPHGVVTINYSVSQVPLPAALQLFGALLAGMFGFSQLKKRKALAA